MEHKYYSDSEESNGEERRYTRHCNICCAGSTQKEQPNIVENVGSLQF